MKSIIAIALFCLFCLDALYTNAQISPSAGITVSVFPLNPQSGSNNYFGVSVTLDQTYDQNISVSGYIYDQDGPANQDHPFSITVNSGDLTNSTSATFYQTSPTTEAVASTNSISPVNITKGNLTYNTQFFINGSLYDYFDSKFSNIGQFHNFVLASVINTSSLPSSATTYSGAITNIQDFNKYLYNNNGSSYLGTLIPTSESDSAFDNYKYFVNAQQFISNALSNGTFSIDSAKTKINSIPEINSSNKLLFTDIANTIDSCLNGYLDYNQSEQSYTRLANSWITINSGNENSTSAQLTGSIISISLESSEFWRQNSANVYTSDYIVSTTNNFCDKIYGSLVGPQVERSNTYFVLPWVALDAAGALVSAGTSAVGQYLTRGSISAKGVLIGAGIGAITASTGVVGKVASWIGSLF
jgi:hypothetical protein